MADTKHHSFSTELDSYTLFFDGSVQVDSSKVLDLIESGVPPRLIYCNNLTPDLIEYNKFASKNDKIKNKETVEIPEVEWSVSNSVLDVDIYSVLMDKLQKDLNLPSSQTTIKERASRFEEEFELFKRDELLPLLKILVHIINRMLSESIVWGVGRGSSTSSYILYLIGMHDIDPILHDITIDDFFHK